MKRCSVCKIMKEKRVFSKDKYNSDGLRSYCKDCQKIQNTNTRQKMTEEDRQNKKEYVCGWSEKNRESINIRVRNYRTSDPKKIRTRENIQNTKKLSKTEYRLAHNLRCRLNTAMKKNYKKGSAVKDLGCTVDYLKTYLESKFQPGMSWKNWSVYGWHIDHIIPLSKFNLSKREDFIVAVHYTNLQPLWAKENLKKYNKASS